MAQFEDIQLLYCDAEDTYGTAPASVTGTDDNYIKPVWGFTYQVLGELNQQNVANGLFAPSKPKARKNGAEFGFNCFVTNEVNHGSYTTECVENDFLRAAGFALGGSTFALDNTPNTSSIAVRYSLADIYHQFTGARASSVVLHILPNDFAWFEFKFRANGYSWGDETISSSPAHVATTHSVVNAITGSSFFSPVSNLGEVVITLENELDIVPSFTAGGVAEIRISKRKVRVECDYDQVTKATVDNFTDFENVGTNDVGFSCNNGKLIVSISHMSQVGYPQVSFVNGVARERVILEAWTDGSGDNLLQMEYSN